MTSDQVAVTPADGVDLATFRSLVEVDTDPSVAPHAAALVHGVPVYDAASLRAASDDPTGEATTKRELAAVLHDGPGVLAIRDTADHAVLDEASGIFEQILRDEHAAGLGAGDHYAKPGANERIWNAIEKLAVAAPDVFVAYHGNPMIDLVASAWLGPGYQVSTQVNVINPGGEAQAPHRDYHLGFMTDERAAAFPRHTHLLSATLTLQGALAHVDASAEAGSTKLLPHSQKYDLGYLAWRRPEFIDYFEANHVQLDLHKGDLVFFNPALFHAGGHNRTTDVRRMVNLLQISSPLGRAMETIDRTRMLHAVYPSLRRAHDEQDDRSFRAALTACTDGYAFPTNLDRDPPLGGLTPPSQFDLVARALADDLGPDALAEVLSAHAERRRTH